MKRVATQWFEGCRLFALLLAFLLSSASAYGIPTGADGYVWATWFDPEYSYRKVHGDSPVAVCRNWVKTWNAIPPDPLYKGPLWDYEFLSVWGPYNSTSAECGMRAPDPRGPWEFYVEAWREDKCAAGYSLQPNGTCEPTRLPVKSCPVSHPVFPGTGVKILMEHDDFGSQELPLSRTYRSHILYGFDSGKGQWLFEWQREIDSLAANDSGKGSVTALRGDGDVRAFHKNGGKWSAAGTADTLERLAESQRVQDSWGDWEYRDIVTWRYTVGTTGAVEIYDSNGRLQSVQAPGHRPTTLAYNKAGQLVSATAPSGRTLQFAYDAQGNVSSATAPGGAVTKYAYNANGMLSTVTWPDNTTRQYVYEDTRFPTALTGVIDEAGVRYATYAYDDQGRAITSELTGGVDRYQFQYQPDGQTTVLTPDGGSTVYSFLKQNGELLPTGVSAPCPSCGKTSFSSEYDTNGNATREVGYDGAATTYTYDAQGRETQRVEAAGTANAKTTTTEWHPTWNLPTRVASPGKLETFAYDANSNLTAYTSVGTADANGGAGFAAVPNEPIKRTDWTYDGSGHVLTATERTGNAVTGTWTLTYDAQGNLLALANPEGKTGRIATYDEAGRVLEAIDVNGANHKFAYNARGWLMSHEVGGQYIRYEYNAIGQRTAVLGPQDLVTRYVYDSAHRLTEILSNMGLPEGSVQTGMVSPFGVAQVEQETAHPTVLQTLREAAVRAWNGVLNWIKQWLSELIKSAHAQVPTPSGGLTSIYRPSSPIPMGPQRGNQSPYPEDVLDPDSRSHVRPDLLLKVVKALERIGNVICRGDDTSREECKQEAVTQYEDDAKNCSVAHIFWGKPGYKECMNRASDRLVERMKECDGK